MTTEMGSAFRVVLTLTLFTSACEIGVEPRFASMEADQASRIDSWRPLIDDPPEALSWLEAYRELQIPQDLRGFFPMRRPSTIDLHGPPICEIVVGDRGDGALHIFDLEGRYRRTITGGASDTSLVRFPASVTVGGNGAIGVMSMGGGRTVIFDREGQVREMWRVEPVVRGAAVASQVSLTDSGWLVEHPVGNSLAIRSAEWERGGPLIRVYKSGREATRAGSMWVVPGRLFTPMVNMGRVESRGDTAWYARKIDASVIKFIPNGDMGFSASDTIRLPVFYHAMAPFEATTEGSSGRFSEAHLNDLAVDETGRLFVSQNRAWQPSGGPEVRVRRIPETVLTVYTGSGDLLRIYDMEGLLHEVAVASGTIVGLVELPAPRGFVVRLFKDPMVESVRQDECS